MKKTVIFKGTLFALSMTSAAYADNIGNPYAIFDSAPTSGNAAQVQTTLPAPAQNATPISLPAAAPVNSAPQIQYVQAANQVGKSAVASSTSQGVNFAAPTVKSSGSAPALQSATSGINPQSLQGQQRFGIQSDGDGDGNADNVYGDVLGQIEANTSSTSTKMDNVVNNTGTTATSTAASQTALESLLKYWNTPPVYSNQAVTGDFKSFLTASPYGPVALLNSQSVGNDVTAIRFGTEFADLSVDWPTIIAENPPADPAQPELSPLSLATHLPYASLMTEGLSQGAIPKDYWAPALNQALFDLSVNKPSMDSLKNAVLVPFNSENDNNASVLNWKKQVQQATNPDLLRMIVVQQAINNALLYQILQRENDQTLMQASQLRMLSELNASINRAGRDQTQQLQRVVDAIERQNSK